MRGPVVPRSDFPILERKTGGMPLVYLDNAATTHKPSVVIDRIAGFYRSENSNSHRGVHRLSEEATVAMEEARRTVRDFIGARSEREVIFTGGTTDSINLVAASFGERSVGAGDEVIVTELEHHSNILPWQQLCIRKGAVLRAVPIGPDGTLDIGQYERLLSERTRLVAVALVSNTTGTVNPVERMVSAAHEHGVPVLVDAAQAAPHLATDVNGLGCDFLAFSGHKAYAGMGIGILYGREERLERMPPCRTGGGMVERVDMKGADWADLPLKFEAGTPNVAGALGLQAALEYLRAAGMDRIEEAERDLYDYALSRLSEVGGVTIYGGGTRRCGSISFNIEGLHHYDVGKVLDRLGIAVRTGKHCAEPAMDHFGVTGTVRASLGIYNTAGEVDALLEGLEKARRVLGG